MSNVTLSIGGRDYMVACADGEEGHITALGHAVDRKLASLPGAAGLSEVRALLFTALVADELHEARAATPRQAELGLDNHAPAADPLTPALDRLAGRLEQLATQFEAGA
jgi:cell division protein ZapA